MFFTNPHLSRSIIHDIINGIIGRRIDPDLWDRAASMKKGNPTYFWTRHPRKNCVGSKIWNVTRSRVLSTKASKVAFIWVSCWRRALSAGKSKRIEHAFNSFLMSLPAVGFHGASSKRHVTKLYARNIYFALLELSVVGVWKKLKGTQKGKNFQEQFFQGKLRADSFFSLSVWGSSFFTFLSFFSFFDFPFDFSLSPLLSPSWQCSWPSPAKTVTAHQKGPQIHPLNSMAKRMHPPMLRRFPHWTSHWWMPGQWAQLSPSRCICLM